MRRVALGLAGALLLASTTSTQQIQIFSTQQPPGAPGMPPGAPPSRDTAPKIGTARLRGRVVAADTGQPLRKAQVRIVSPELRENRMTTTDAGGAYEFRELPAGRYTVTASKGSYVALQYGQLRPFEPGKPLEVADQQTLEKIDFALPHGGIITGRIVDEFGEPAAEVQVAAMRYQFIQGRKRLTPAGRPSMTNDIGEVRIFALPPGQYYLSATLRNMMMMMDSASDDRSGYAPTYYPGTPNVAEAQRLNVGIGQSLTDINLSLVQTRTARVSGTAVDSAGKPLSGGFIMVIQRSGAMFMASGGGQIRPDGSFSISNLAPGEYTFQAQVPGAMGPFEGETAMANVTVNGDDITGVQLMGVRPATITGRIVVDPAEAASVQPSSFRLMAMAKTEDLPMMGGGAGKVNDDFTFELKVRPGAQLIRLNQGPGARTLMVKSVRLGGADVTDSGIDVRAGQDIDGVEVELTSRVSEVSGVATNARGVPSKDYTVVLFPQDSERWGWQSRYIGTGRPDQDGRFKVRNLPAGNYLAIAVDYLEPGEANDPEFLERVRDKAITFSLGDGETKTLDLKLTSMS